MAKATKRNEEINERGLMAGAFAKLSELYGNMQPDTPYTLAMSMIFCSRAALMSAPANDFNQHLYEHLAGIEVLLTEMGGKSALKADAKVEQLFNDLAYGEEDFFVDFISPASPKRKGKVVAFNA